MRFMIDRTQGFMSVDGVLFDIDTSTLPSGVVYVHWHEDDLGSIQHEGYSQGVYLNPSPYAGYLNQWIVAGATLAQAKAAKCGLIQAIYEFEKQEPVTVSVAGVPYQWDASDDAVTDLELRNASTNAAIDGVSAQVHTVANGVNQVAVAVNDVAAGVNVVAAGVNTVAAHVNAAQAGIESVVSEINTVIGGVHTAVDDTNAVASKVNALLAAFDGLKGTVASLASQTQSALDTIYSLTGNYGSLPTISLSYPSTPTDMVDAPHPLSTFTLAPALVDAPTDLTTSLSTTLETLPTDGPDSMVPLIPIGQTTPVDLTVAQFQAIIDAISAQRMSKLATNLAKQAAVNALTTVGAIAALDATTGW